MRRLALVVTALLCLVASRLVRSAALDTRARWPKLVNIPYAPSPELAPYVTLGYRELGADLLWIRMIGYLGGRDDTADGVRGLVEGTLGLDDHFRPAYDAGALAIQSADHGVDEAAHLTAIAILERGMRIYPDRWQYPYLAGQTYVVDLTTTDPVKRRAWNERGVALLEKAVRLPRAPAREALLAAHLQSQLGRHEAAVNNLKELILITSDARAQKDLIAKLAELERRSSAEIAIELLDERRTFEAEWLGARPALPATMYVLLGPRRRPYLAPADLAVDRDLIGTQAPEPLEPLDPE